MVREFPSIYILTYNKSLYRKDNFRACLDISLLSKDLRFLFFHNAQNTHKRNNPLNMLLFFIHKGIVPT